MKRIAKTQSNGHAAVAFDTAPMEARTANALPDEKGLWQYEPKWDGFRCLAFKSAGEVELRSKSGKSLSRFFPEVVAGLAALPLRDFVLDGELVIEIDGHAAFDALQMRLHPAESRIKKLSSQTPACLIAFDLLVDEKSEPLLEVSLNERRERLETLLQRIGDAGVVKLSPRSRDVDEANRWLAGSGHGTDGVIAKRLDDTYQPGERAMVKVKNLRTADCVVGGFRYASQGRGVGSLLLGLYDGEGRLDHVGFTSSISDDERPALTKRLEKLKQAPGFTGKAPGGPSRWSTERSAQWEPLKPQLVVEVRFDHVTGDRFRHGTKFLRWRPDKAPKQCTFEQIAPPAMVMPK